MIKMKHKYRIEATPADVWAYLSNYMRVDLYCPEIESVEPLTSGPDGMGSRRRNIFRDGSSLVEEVTDWSEGQGYSVALSEMGNIPLTKAEATISVAPQNGATLVTWEFRIRFKFGPLGWVMGQTLMRAMMGKIIKANLRELDRLVTTKTGHQGHAAPAH